MSLKKFLLSRVFLKQIIIAAIFIIVLLVIITQGLKLYTHHGESYPVPDFTGLNQDDAMGMAKSQHVKAEIVDSVYLNDAMPGTIVDQIPEPGFKVKENRTVFLTVNSRMPEQVTIPKLTDISFRQAQVLVENSGLKIGQIIYQPSEYNNLVLKVMIDSLGIQPGIKVAKGTGVDLVIGRTEGNIATPLPELTGLTAEEAQNTLINAMLNPGVLIYDQSVYSKEDSINARVWRQRPTPETTATVNLGSSVDIWLTVDQLKIEDETELNF
jgi:beta-lactam-binding protein with PASTA domain